MKVFDLYLGREVAIPERVEAGRFRLTKPAVLNERLQLGKGEVLLSDGGSAAPLVPRSILLLITDIHLRARSMTRKKLNDQSFAGRWHCWQPVPQKATKHFRLRCFLRKWLQFWS